MAWAEGCRAVNEGVRVSHASMKPMKLEHCGFDEEGFPPP